MEGKIITKERMETLQESEPFLKMNDLVYRLLQDAILSARFQPGERLHVSSIAKELNVSITPVRNAVKRLVDAGLVEEDADTKTYYVFNISDKLLEDIFDTRRMFEGTAAAICAQRYTLINLKALKYMAEEFQKLWLQSINSISNPENMRKRAEIDQEFHNLLVHSTGNEYIIRYYQELQQAQTHSLLRAMDFWDQDPNPDNKRILSGQHLAIYHAIESGLPEQARRTAEDHMDFCKFRCILNRKY